MKIEQDTGGRENKTSHPADPHQTASGSSHSPGGKDASAETTNHMTHGQEGYPGARDAGASADRNAEVNNAQTPSAGDADPDSTASSDATGQAGVNDRPGKDKAHPWNG